MGSLKPGDAYIYERVDNTVYRRKFRADPNTREPTGYEYDSALHDHIQESRLWEEIHRAAGTNPTLQDALERVIMIYNLTKPQ